MIHFWRRIGCILFSWNMNLNFSGNVQIFKSRLQGYSYISGIKYMKVNFRRITVSAKGKISIINWSLQIEKKIKYLSEEICLTAQLKEKFQI